MGQEHAVSTCVPVAVSYLDLNGEKAGQAIPDTVCPVVLLSRSTEGGGKADQSDHDT
jgi:hypothetical protein